MKNSDISINNVSKFTRSHPIKILENTSKYFLFLLLPLLRALFVYTGGLQAWLRGAWFDILIIALILGLGTYHWYNFLFSFDKEGLYIVKGIIIKQRRYIPYKNISSVTWEKPWYFYPIRASRMRADTDGGISKVFDFSVTLGTRKSKGIMYLLKTLHNAKFVDKTATKTHTPKSVNIAIFSLITSNSIAGVLYISTAITQFSNFLGDELEKDLINNFTTLASTFNFGLPPFAAIIGYTLLGCWAVSFAVNIINHVKFKVVRKNNLLNIYNGLFSKREFIVDVSYINYLFIRQTLFSKIVGFFSVFINCTGYGKKKNELAVLLPSGESHEIRLNLEFLLPEIPIVKAQIKPQKNNLPRFIILPICLVLGIILICVVLLYFFKSFSDYIIFGTIMVIVPAFLWLIIKCYSYFFTGVGTAGNIVTLYYTKGFGIYTSSFDISRIAKIDFSQTIFQQFYKGCDINFYTVSEKRIKQTIPSLNLSQAKKLFKYLKAKSDNLCE